MGTITILFIINQVLTSLYGALSGYLPKYKSREFYATIDNTGIVAIPDINTNNAIILEVLCTSHNDTIVRVGHYSSTFWVQVLDSAGNIAKGFTPSFIVYFLDK